MGLQPVKTISTGGIPVWIDIKQLYPGGFTLVTTGLNTANLVVAGTPLLVSETARTATVVKTAILQADAADNATTYRVLKGHHFAVGDYLAQVVGGKAYAITAIDTSNAAYDVLTVGTTLGVALTATDGIVLFQSSATGAAAAALTATPNALLQSDCAVESFTGVNAVMQGLVYERRTPGLLAAFKTALKVLGIQFSATY